MIKVMEWGSMEKESLKGDVEKCYKITVEQGKGQVAKSHQRRGKHLKTVQLSSGTPCYWLSRL